MVAPGTELGDRLLNDRGLSPPPWETRAKSKEGEGRMEVASRPPRAAGWSFIKATSSLRVPGSGQHDRPSQTPEDVTERLGDTLASF